jgi:anti-sigma factor RsiW
MNECGFTAKVSELIDGELDPDQIEPVTLHLASCPICRQAREDFLDARSRIRDYSVTADAAARARTLEEIVGRRRIPWWRRSISVPLPVAAAALLLIVGVAVWIRTHGTTSSVGDRRIAVTQTAADENSNDVASLSRYDAGGRLIIYKKRRAEEENKRQ